MKWSFDTETVFERLNAYLLRLHDVSDIIVAANDFLKLEKIEIGGIKGRHLCERIRSVLTEFHTLHNSCIINHTNLLEPSNNQFKELKRNFQTTINILERKLSQIFMETFVYCNSAESSIKAIEMFGNLLKRPVVNEQISFHIDNVFKIIQCDIKAVHRLLMDSSYGKQTIRVR